MPLQIKTASTLALALLGAITTATALADPQSSDPQWGATAAIESTHLDSTRTLWIALPEGYDSSDERYPALYLLDGQIYFHYGVGYHRAFRQFDKTPEFLVVGIESRRPDRFRHFNAGADAYRRFLEAEVVAYVDRHYRTTDERLLFGWEYGGGLVVELLSAAPGLFSGLIAASPYPLDDRVAELETRSEASALQPARLFFAVGEDEGSVEAGVRSLASALETLGKAGPVWRLESLAGEHHTTTPHRTLYQGLRFYFDGYEWLSFGSLDELDQRGGLDFVRDYYRRRGERYGLATAIHRQTMHNLALLAYRAEDLPRFEAFLDSFDGFLEGTNHGWLNNFAEFYLEHERPERARDVLAVAAERFPESARVHNNLGHAFRRLDQLGEARSAFRQAVALAEQRELEQAEAYRLDLEALGQEDATGEAAGTQAPKP